MLAYWGNVQVLGTPYWENLPGLQKAAQTYACTTPEELAAHLKALTHIVMFGLDGFPRSYVELLGKDPAHAQLARLLEDPNERPAGFVPLDLKTPDWLGGKDFWIRVLQAKDTSAP